LSFVETSEAFAIECDDPACPTDGRNLVWQAAERVWRAGRRSGPPSGVRVRIEKRIPMAAGLGGGSSDAAAALRACARLWRVKNSRLPAIAAALGADVPFFLHGGKALGVGRGDVVRPLRDDPPAWVLLVLPPFGVRTADAYRWWDESPRPPGVGSPATDKRMDGATNELEAPVAARHPEIARIVAALRQAGASSAAMSGSGSAVFGIFNRRKLLHSAASSVPSFGGRTLVTRTLPRARFRAKSRLGR
jgi:4-diphosphocytidyl-2-C-methyl-D-erythritol kinase